MTQVSASFSANTRYKFVSASDHSKWWREADSSDVTQGVVLDGAEVATDFRVEPAIGKCAGNMDADIVRLVTVDSTRLIRHTADRAYTADESAVTLAEEGDACWHLVRGLCGVDGTFSLISSNSTGTGGETKYMRVRAEGQLWADVLEDTDAERATACFFPMANGVIAVEPPPSEACTDDSECMLLGGKCLASGECGCETDVDCGVKACVDSKCVDPTTIAPETFEGVDSLKNNLLNNIFRLFTSPISEFGALPPTDMALTIAAVVGAIIMVIFMVVLAKNTIGGLFRRRRRRRREMYDDDDDDE